MRLHPSFFVHQFSSSERLEELQDSLDASGRAADVFQDFDTGGTGSTYIGVLLNSAGNITHVCRLQRKKTAGVGLRSISFNEIEEITKSDAELIQTAIKSSFHNRRKVREFNSGLKLTKSENEKTIAYIEKYNPLLADRLYAKGRADLRHLRKYTDKEIETLVLERDALGAAMDFALDNREQLRVTTSPVEKVDSFLALVDAVGSIEDEFIMFDMVRFPDMKKLGATSSRRATFVSGGKKLDVIHANRNKLETTYGADLIYYHANFGFLLCVQYKMLEETPNGFYFRPDAGFHKQLTKMQEIEESTQKISSSHSEADYRLHAGPFFYKFVSRLEKNLADNALCPGLYMPMDLVKELVSASPSIAIGRNDNQATRHFSNSEFASIVSGGWVGCHGTQIQIFEELIRASLHAGKSVLAAIGDERR